MNVHAPENNLWNDRYGLKIPVLHLYRRVSPSTPMTVNHELETVFSNTPRREWKDGKYGFTKEEFCVMDFEKKEMKFSNAENLAAWIWRENT